MRWVGTFGVIWGLVGVLALLVFAVCRLAPRALEAYEMGLTGLQWLILILFCLFMAYTEGYRGFQKSFSPRTAARIRYLRDRPSFLRSLLAPLFTMGFFHADLRTKIVAWSVTTGIAALVVLVHRLDQPWRGIIDAGVVLGLTWGLVSLIECVRRALTTKGFEALAGLPNGEAR